MSCGPHHLAPAGQSVGIPVGQIVGGAALTTDAADARYLALAGQLAPRISIVWLTQYTGVLDTEDEAYAVAFAAHLDGAPAPEPPAGMDDEIRSVIEADMCDAAGVTRCLECGQYRSADPSQAHNCPASATVEPEPPEDFKHYADGPEVQDWEVSEDDYLLRRYTEKRQRLMLGAEQLEAQAERLRQSIEEYEADYKQRETPLPKVERDYQDSRRRELEVIEAQLAGYREQLARSEPEETDLVLWRSEYAKAVKAALKDGLPVPLPVIAQRPEFRTAHDARARYYKGWNTAFGNRSLTVDASQLESRGYKRKRQDGKPLTSEQAAEIEAAVQQIETAFGGPLQEVLRPLDITISHTHGRRPFMMSKAAGVFFPSEWSLAVGYPPWRATGHELAHVLDFAAGQALGVETFVQKGDSLVPSTSLAEHEGASELIREADKLINNRREIDLPKSERKRETADGEDAAALADPKVLERQAERMALGAYWHEPCEIFARLVEQYIATETGGGHATESTGRIQTAPGWWKAEDFEKLRPRVRAEIERRLEILRGNVEESNRMTFGKLVENRRWGLEQTERFYRATIGFSRNPPSVDIVLNGDKSWRVERRDYNRQAGEWESEVVFTGNLEQARQAATDYLTEQQRQSRGRAPAAKAPEPLTSVQPPTPPGIAEMGYQLSSNKYYMQAENARHGQPRFIEVQGQPVVIKGQEAFEYFLAEDTETPGLHSRQFLVDALTGTVMGRGRSPQEALDYLRYSPKSLHEEHVSLKQARIKRGELSPRYTPHRPEKPVAAAVPEPVRAAVQAIAKALGSSQPDEAQRQLQVFNRLQGELPGEAERSSSRAALRAALDAHYPPSVKPCALDMESPTVNTYLSERYITNIRHRFTALKKMAERDYGLKIELKSSSRSYRYWGTWDKSSAAYQSLREADPSGEFEAQIVDTIKRTVDGKTLNEEKLIGDTLVWGRPETIGPRYAVQRDLSYRINRSLAEHARKKLGFEAEAVA